MLVFISDVHIRKIGDERAELFLQFLNHDLVAQAKKIYLLGDIFDLMVGSKQGYIHQFEPIFRKIKEIAITGKTIHFVEGNHDFHVRKLFEEYFCPGQFVHHTQPFIEEYEGIRFLVCHGDEIELENPSYERYRRFIKSDIIRDLANTVVPYRVIRVIGERASKTSRKYSANYENQLVKEKYIRSARVACEKYGVSKIICGHSHIQEHFIGNGIEYLNNGYFPSSHTFSIIKNQKFLQVRL